MIKAVRLSRCVSVNPVCKIATRPRKKTGGGGGGGDGGSNNNDRDREKIGNYNVWVLTKLYFPQAAITPDMVVKAMTHRWGRPYFLRVFNDGQNLSVCVTPTQYDKNERQHVAEARVLCDILNVNNLGVTFIDFIKFDANAMKDPRNYESGEQVLSLNIPTDGERFSEWNI